MFLRPTGVDAVKTDTLIADFKGVAIDDAGLAGDVGLGILREQNYQYGVVT